MGCDFSIDDLDFFIINDISNGINSTWEIAKKYFDLTDKDNHLITAKNNLIKNRLKKMSEWGLINISKEKNSNKNEYQLIKEHLQIGKHKFPDGYFDSIQLKINNSWVRFQKETER